MKKVRELAKKTVSRSGVLPSLRDNRGLSTVEYILLLALIVAAMVGLWTTFGGKIQGMLSNANDKLDEVGNTEGGGGGGD